MSMSKRLLFDRNPRDDDARERLRLQTSSYLADFPHRLAMRRRARPDARYWDRRWPMSVEQAVRELDIEVVRINGGMFARERIERDQIITRAEEIWRTCAE